MKFIEILVIGVLLVAALLVFAYNGNNFERQCVKAGGEAVWDGRQYQCLKPVTTPLT